MASVPISSAISRTRRIMFVSWAPRWAARRCRTTGSAAESKPTRSPKSFRYLHRLHGTDSRRVLSSEDAGGTVIGSHLAEIGNDFAAPIDGDRAPGVEDTPRRRVERARHLAAEHHALPLGLQLRIGDRHR